MRRFDKVEVRMSAGGSDAGLLLLTAETGELPRPPVATGCSAAWENVNVSGYQVLAELGRGGTAVVYEARQLSLNRLVALKMLLPGAHAGEVELARLHAEAAAIAGLCHPNIIQIYEIGEQNGLPYLSLEYCAGGSLDRKINGTALIAEQAAALIETLARAIHAAHLVGVIHRDLKPANVLLTNIEGQPKITDFGLATTVGGPGRTQTGQILGTPSYMAPEQAAGQNKQISAATDVYALGAILYESLTGRPPFRAAHPLETIALVLHHEPAPPRLLNAAIEIDLQTICLKCLEKDPKRRYATALELADELRRYLAHEPIRAHTMNPLDRFSRMLGRNYMGVDFFIWSNILFYFAEVNLLIETGLWTLVSARFPLIAIDLMQAFRFVLMALPFWYYRSQTLLPRERQLWSIWIGYVLACSTVAVVSHTLLGVDKLYAFYLYPYLAISTGFAFFVMGARYWGRCYVFGASFFVLAGLMPFILRWSALAFGLLWCGCLVSIGRHLRRVAVESAAQRNRPARWPTAKDADRAEEDRPKQPQPTIPWPQAGL
jgi:eukaryotic-like serine/threonine-protein kinase